MSFFARCLLAPIGASCLASILGCSSATPGAGFPASVTPLTSRQEFSKGASKMSRDVYVVRNGNDFDAMPVSVARIYRGFQGLHVINLASGEEKTYPPAAKVIRETVEFVNVPHTGLPMFLMGHCSEVMTLVERPPTKDLVPYTGSPSLSGGGSGGDQGTITSSSANCEAGGAELGVTFTVPDRYPGNVTVTLCSTGNPCYYFENIEPGSTHSVSIYSPGARSVYGVSMGIVFNGFTTPGVGGATIPGCSSD